jgi:hypothetical protein
MTDRELLELAAKAAGLTIDKSPYSGGGNGNDGFDLSGDAVLDWHNGVKWNPLTDDGDALRLASYITAYGFDFARLDSIAAEALQRRSDMNAAIRRAIVSAAAEIGAAK